MKKLSIFLFIAFSFTLLLSCGGVNDSHDRKGKEVALCHARLLRMYRYGAGTLTEIRNPWDTTATLASYLLWPKDSGAPEYSGSAKIVRVPLDRSVVFSGVYASLIRQFGHENSIQGVCDAEYISDPEIRRLIRDGRIKDCGNNQMPDAELIAGLRPEAVLMSPYEGSTGSRKFQQMGIPVIECADYMESTPLARAEWMKFYGLLYGESEKATKEFNQVEKEYNRLKTLSSSAASKPRVLFDRIYSGSWYVPEKYSTTGRFIEDAGAENPFSYLTSSGSAPLSGEDVLVKAGNADFWLIRHSGENLNYEGLGSDNPIYSRLQPYRHRNIYIADTSASGLFDDAAFHPHWLLSDLISIFHPELEVKPFKNYYTPLQ